MTTRARHPRLRAAITQAVLGIGLSALLLAAPGAPVHAQEGDESAPATVRFASLIETLPPGIANDIERSLQSGSNRERAIAEFTFEAVPLNISPTLFVAILEENGLVDPGTTARLVRSTAPGAVGFTLISTDSQ